MSSATIIFTLQANIIYVQYLDVVVLRTYDIYCRCLIIYTNYFWTESKSSTRHGASNRQNVLKPHGLFLCIGEAAALFVMGRTYIMAANDLYTPRKYSDLDQSSAGNIGKFSLAKGKKYIVINSMCLCDVNTVWWCALRFVFFFWFVSHSKYLLHM